MADENCGCGGLLRWWLDEPAGRLAPSEAGVSAVEGASGREWTDVLLMWKSLLCAIGGGAHSSKRLGWRGQNVHKHGGR